MPFCRDRVAEVVPNFIPLDDGEEGIQLPVVQHPLGAAALLGDCGALRGVLGDHMRLHCVLHRQMEHAVDAAHRGVGKLIALFGVLVGAPFFFEPPVHPLDVLRGDQGNLLAAQLGLDVLLN